MNATFLPVFLLVMLLNLCLIAALIWLLILLVRALRKYLKSAPAREEKAALRQTLGERIRAVRQARGMTQEFVAESLGVSRQAVSKWESGASDPSTSNLLALAKLLDIPAETLLNDLDTP